MAGSQRMAAVGQYSPKFFGYRHTPMASTGAAESDRQIRLTFLDVGGDKKLEQRQRVFDERHR